jgi:glycosyltransferase involved in cell wall biosynthesis
VIPVRKYGAPVAAAPASTGVTNESLTVFFPAYNDAPSLPLLISRTFETLENYPADFEVIVINDGSYDDTAHVLAELEAQYSPRMRVITHPRNRGYGGTLQTGFLAATKDLVFYTDGDGQYDVRELPKLLALMQPGTGLVNGYKLERNDAPYRIWIGNIYNAFARFLFRIRIRDVDCDFRLIRRSLLQDTPLTSTSGTICVELVSKLERSSYGVEEIGVHHYARLHGKSQFFRLRSILQTLRQLVQLYLRLAGSRRSQ